MQLAEVINIINSGSVTLYRRSNSIEVEGDCPLELKKALTENQAALLPYLQVHPNDVEEVAANELQRELDDFFAWLAEHRYAWLDVTAIQNICDEPISEVCQGGNVAEVRKEINRLKGLIDAIDWAATCMPLSVEAVEVKRAAAKIKDKTPF
ncbi:MAG: hypothetical protein ABGZ17_28795 [Planctomycetaceae bacterium]